MLQRFKILIQSQCIVVFTVVSKWGAYGRSLTPKFLVFFEGKVRFIKNSDSDFMCLSVSRSIRKWWMALPPNKKQLFREWTWRRRWHLLGAGSGLLIFISLLFLTHLDESPITGRTRLLLFSKEAFMELTQSTAEAVRLVKSAQLVQSVYILNF